MNTIYLVRHAEADLNHPHLHLNEKGIQQGQKLGEWLKNKNYPIPDHVYTSDRQRAIQTADHILNSLNQSNIERTITNHFQECNPPKELTELPDYQKQIKLNKKPELHIDWPNKQTAIQTFLTALDNASQEYQTVLIISHAQILQYVLQELFKETLDLYELSTSNTNAALTVLFKENRKYKLNKLFSTVHLIS